MSTYVIRESGRNGSVEVKSGVLTRTIKRRMGKNDEEIIPIKSILHIKHDRKTLGTDVVILTTSSMTLEWKIKRSSQAEQMVTEIKAHMTAEG